MGKTIKEIAESIGVTYQAIDWYRKRSLYLDLAKKSNFKIKNKDKTIHNSIPVTIGGVIYKSKSEASRKLGISFFLVDKMIKEAIIRLGN